MRRREEGGWGAGEGVLGRRGAGEARRRGEAKRALVLLLGHRDWDGITPAS